MIILGLFYTFKTKQRYEVSLTSAHNIPVFVPEKNKIEFLPASKVTLKHRLIMFGANVEIENISLTARQGFYSPLTLSGYLFVNNISTSVFSDRYLFQFIFLKNLKFFLCLVIGHHQILFNVFLHLFVFIII
jgi:hypothetical protein